MAEDPKHPVLNVTILTPERLVYPGKAERVILPGEQGVFEILPHHKTIRSRLLKGRVVVDRKVLKIRRGVVKAGMNDVTLIVEEAA